MSASELLVNREQKRRGKYNNTESELDTIDRADTIDINNNKSEDSEESQLEMANIHNIHSSEEPPPVVEKLRKNSSEHLLPGTFLLCVSGDC